MVLAGVAVSVTCEPIDIGAPPPPGALVLRVTLGVALVVTVNVVEADAVQEPCVTVIFSTYVPLPEGVKVVAAVFVEEKVPDGPDVFVHAIVLSPVMVTVGEKLMLLAPFKSSSLVEAKPVMVAVLQFTVMVHVPAVVATCALLYFCVTVSVAVVEPGVEPV